MKKCKWTILCGALLALFTGVSLRTNTVSASNVSSVNTVASYFEAGEDMQFVTNSSTPSYVAKERNCVLVDSPNGGVLKYNNVIETTKLTKENLLFEMQITPRNAGEIELNQFIIRLEDAEDPRTYINVSLYTYTYGYGMNGLLSQMTVKTSTIESYKGIKYTNNFNSEKQADNVTSSVKTGIKQGSELYAPFYGNKNGHSESVRLYYDDNEHAIYTVNDNVYSPLNGNTGRNTLIANGIADTEGRFVVLDLDNYKHMGTLKSNLFMGFPSGKARLSVTTNEVLGESARYTVLTIDDQTFDGTYLNDRTIPELSVELEGYEENTLPQAVVNREYPLFTATANDKMYGALQTMSRVYFGGEEIYCTSNGFIPKSVGEYTLVYEATDGNGNKASKTFTLQAVSATEINGTLCVSKGEYDFGDLELINVNGNYKADLYYPITLPTMHSDGGVGRVSVTTRVSFNGNPVEVTDDTFTPNQKGVYVVEYILQDYVGTTKIYTYTIETAYSSLPNLSEPNVPTYLSVNKPALLPAVNSELYTPWKQKIDAYNKITVYKADGVTVLFSQEGNDGAVYTPKETDGDTVVVEYLTAKDKNSTPVIYRKTVKLVPAEKLVDRFVIDEGVSVDEKSASLNFSFTGEEQNVTFVNPLPVYEGLVVNFAAIAEKNNFSEVQFTFTDSENPNIYLTVNIYKNADSTATESEIAVNGKNIGNINSSFYGNVIDTFRFTLSQAGGVYNYNDELITLAEDFEGFTSGLVYLSFTVKGVTGDASIQLKQLLNQITGETDEDFIKPVLTVLEKPVGSAKLGEAVKIGSAVANDAYDSKTSLEVSVTFNEKQVFSQFYEYGRFDGALFYATDYGKYTITYTAIDSSGNETVRTYNVAVADAVAPTIRIDGEMPTTGRVGEKLSVAHATALDNAEVDLTVYVVIIDPMNVFNVIAQGEEYIAPHKGRYIVKYYVEDSHYNTTYSESFVINVE